MQDNSSSALTVATTSSSHTSIGLLDFPPEILLHILSYLDLPELAILAQLSPTLAPLTTDPVLHFQRLWIVSPSRLNHNLFGKGPDGLLLRPTVGDLVQRGYMRGLGIERRWRMGAYFYSLDSIIQYENGRALLRRHAQHVLTDQLKRRGRFSFIKNRAIINTTSFVVPSTSNSAGSSSHGAASIPVNPFKLTATSFSSGSTGSGSGSNRIKHTSSSSSSFKAYLMTLHSTHILPDIETSSPIIARSLLPTMRKLKWCLQRDNLAREFKNSGRAIGLGKFLADDTGGNEAGDEAADNHDEEKRRNRKRVLFHVESEKVRLAVCPGVKKRVWFYEGLGGKAEKV